MLLVLRKENLILNRSLMEKFKTVIQENSANLKIKKYSDISKLLEYIRGGKSEAAGGWVNFQWKNTW